MKRAAIIITTLALSLAGCSTTEPGQATSSSTTSQQSPDEFLTTHGLTGMDAQEIITTLDQIPRAERSQELMASIGINELLLSDKNTEISLPLPAEQTYISIAPYISQTHDCFYHSLTTCTGELNNEPIHVVFQDETGQTLIDDNVTTYDNGFAGFWLPKNTTGTIHVTTNNKTATSNFSTTDEGATCITTLQLT